MRPAFRLLPLPFCIALSLTAQAAQDHPESWQLCPVADAVPAFPDAQAPSGRPQARVDLPTDITAYYATLANERSHGGRFDYRSILTDVLAWVMERAAGARFADLVASELWAPMGAEDDAEVTVDGHGNAMADGGVSCTLRDLARFGLLLLRGGRRGSPRPG